MIRQKSSYPASLFDYRVILILFFVCLFYGCQEKQVPLLDTKTTKSKHFEVEYSSCYEKHREEFLNIAETAYKEIRKKMGFPGIRKKINIRFLNFRDWCYIVYIVPTDVVSCGGFSYKYDIVIHGNVFDLEEVLSRDTKNILWHEIAHVLYYNFIGRKKRTPRWFAESIVLYAQTQSCETKRLRAIHPDSLLSLKQMDDLFARRDNAPYPICPNFLWDQAYTVIEYICEKYGKDKLQKLLKCSRREKLEDALKKVISKDIISFEAEWRSWLIERYKYRSLEMGEIKLAKEEPIFVYLDTCFWNEKDTFISRIEETYNVLSNNLLYSPPNKISFYILSMEGFLARFTDVYFGNLWKVKNDTIYVGFNEDLELPLVFKYNLLESLLCEIFLHYFYSKIVSRPNYSEVIPGLIGVGLRLYEEVYFRPWVNYPEFDRSFLLHKEYYPLHVLCESWKGLDGLDYLVAKEESKKFVEFLIEKYGRFVPAKIVHELKDKKFNEAVRKFTDKTLDELEDEFIEWLAQEIHS